MIYGSSGHPIEVKKISVEIWRLRDEIEYVIQTVLKHSGQKTLSEGALRIIAKRYNPNANMEGVALDSTGAPMDDFADAMAAAMAGGGDEEEGEESSEEGEQKAAEESGENTEDENTEDENKEEDKADSSENSDQDADAIAAAMLADNGITPDAQPSNESSAEENSDIGPSEKEKEILDGLFQSDKVTLRRKPPGLDPSKVHMGITFLSDINMKDLAFFTNENFLAGQAIVIQFDVPKAFTIGAEVKMCQDYNMLSKVISTSRPSNRSQVFFTFTIPGEKTMLREFVKSIQPEVKEVKKVQKTEEADEDVDLDDLGL